MADANAYVKYPLPQFRSGTLTTEESRDLNNILKRLHDLIQIDVNFDQILESNDSTYGKVLKTELNADGTIKESILDHDLLNNLAWSVAGHTIDTTFSVPTGNKIQVWNAADTAAIELAFGATGEIKTTGGQLVLEGKTTANLKSDTGGVNLETAGSQLMTFRAGTNFEFQDVDAANAVVLSIASATGNLESQGTLKGTGVIFEGGANDTTLQAGTPSAAVTYVLPQSDGSSGDYLQTDGAGNMSWQTVAAADEKVGVDSGATPDYIGAASSDGVLRTGSLLTYTDGGNFVTLDVAESSLDHTNIQNIGTNTHAQIDTHIANTSNPHSVLHSQTTPGDGSDHTFIDQDVTNGASPTFGDVTVAEDGKVGTAGLYWEFDDSNNQLESVGGRVVVQFSDEALRLATTGVNDSVNLSFYQTSTRRGYIQQTDSNDQLIIASEFGDIVFKTDTAGSEVERLKIGDDGTSTFAGNIIMPEDGIIGIGTSAERIKFDGTGNVIDVEDSTKLRVRDGGQLWLYNGANTHYIQEYNDGTNGYLISTTSMIIQAATSQQCTIRVQGNKPQIAMAGASGNFIMTTGNSGDTLVQTADDFILEYQDGSFPYPDQWTCDLPTGNVVMTGTLSGVTTLDCTALDVNSSVQIDGILDEDDMASDSATKCATQQSIKAYVDNNKAAFFIYQTTAFNMAANNTWYDYDWSDVAATVNNGFTHNNAGANPEQITVTDAGTYEITYSLRSDNTAASGYFNARVLDDGTEIPGSYADSVRDYIQTAVRTFQATIAASSVIELQVGCSIANMDITNTDPGNTPNPTTAPSATIAIKRLY